MTDIGSTNTQPADAINPIASTLEAEVAGEIVGRTVNEESVFVGAVAGQIVGHFVLIRELGRGGMGTVYLAQDRKLGRRVALKFPSKRVAASRETVARFMVEARMTAGFSHPNIVQLHAVDEHLGHPYVVLEFVEGETLRERMERDAPVGRAALRIARAIAAGVQEAHSHGVLHRDLKPENILIGRDGRVRVADFGLAISATSEGGGAIEGTARYMAPEQWIGQPVSASDVWAFGLLFHELLTADLPLGALNQAERVEALFGNAPTPINLAVLEPTVAILIGECLQKKPAERPPMDAVVLRLDELMGDRSQSSSSEGDGPFRGLLAFDERHASLFFGRESEVGAAVERLRDEPILPIVAPSGTGKSSFVRAGLLARLREQERWSLVSCRPGGYPFESLASAITLAQPSNPTKTSTTEHAPSASRAPTSSPADSIDPTIASRLRSDPGSLTDSLLEIAARRHCKVLLFIDALEELYTHDVAPKVVEDFVESIGRVVAFARPEIRVVVALRDDFLGRVAQASQIPLFERIFVLRQLDEKALESVISRPLELFGYRFDDPTVITQMVTEIHGEVACLPLLQFTARQLWVSADHQSKVLTRVAYENLGGVTGSLVKHANGVLSELLPEQVALARIIFLRLVTPQRTRRALVKSALVSGLSEKAPAIVDRLAHARLLTIRRGSGEDNFVELVHEALLRKWDQLAVWIDDARDELSVLAEVRPAAERWARLGRLDRDVWTHTALEDARRVLLRPGVDLPEVVAEFLKAGGAVELRARRRVKAALAVLFGALTLGIAGAVAATVRISREKNLADRARSAAERSSAEVLLEAAEAALLNREGGKATALVRASLERADSVRARVLLQRARSESTRWIVRRGGSPQFHSIPGTPLIASNGEIGRIHLIDERTGHGDWLVGQGGTPFAFAMSSAETLWTVGRESIFRWDMRQKSGAEWMRFSEPSIRESGVFSLNASQLVLLQSDGILLVDVQRRTSVHHALPVQTTGTVACDPTFNYIGVPLVDRTYRVFRREPWAELVSLALEPTASAIAIFAPDSKTLLVANGSSLLEYSLETHASRTFAQGGSPIDGLMTQRNTDRFILERRQSSQTQVWRFGQSAPEHELELDPGESVRVINDRGEGFWTSNRLGLCRLVRLEPQGSPSVRWSGEGIVGLAMTADEQTIVAGAGFNLIHMAVADPSDTRIVEHVNSAILSVALSHNQRWEAFGQSGGLVTIRDRESQVAHRIPTGAQRLFGLEFSPTDTVLAATGNSSQIGRWSVGNFAALEPIDLHRQKAVEVHWSPDGQRLLAGSSNNGSVQILNVADHSVAHEFALGGRAIGADWNTAGEHIAVGAVETLALHDVPTNQTRRITFVQRAFWPSFSADGTLIAVGGGDALVATVPWAQDGTTKYFWGHRRSTEVNHVRFAHHDQWLISSSDDGTVRLWDARSTMPLWRVPAALKPVTERCRASPVSTHEVPTPNCEVAPWRVNSHRGWRDLSDRPTRSMVSSAVEGVIESTARDVVQGPAGKVCIWRNDRRVEYWDLAENSARFLLSSTTTTRPIALVDGCALIAGGQVHIRTDSIAHEETFGANVRAIAAAFGGGVIVATDASIEWHIGATVRRTVRTPTHVQLIYSGHELTVVGSVTGEVFVDQGATGAFVPMQTIALGTHLPTVFLPGPRQTLFAGFDDGTLVLFDTSSGRILWTRQLLGAIQHMLLLENNLHAYSDLAVHFSESFELLTVPMSAVVARAAHDSPGVWENGDVVLRPR